MDKTFRHCAPVRHLSRPTALTNVAISHGNLLGAAERDLVK